MFNKMAEICVSILDDQLIFCLFTVELLRAQRVHSGAPIARKFGNLCIQEILVLRKSSIRMSTPSCKLGWNFAFQVPARSAGHHIKPPTLLEIKNNYNNKKLILSFNLLLMSTLLAWITEKGLEPEIKNNGDQFCLKNYMKIL